MSVIVKYLSLFMDLPKTLIFNFKYFGIKGLISLPVIVSRKVKFVNLKGIIDIEGGLGRGKVKIGYSDAGNFDKRYDRTLWDVSGSIVFKGSAKIGYGSKISVGEKGKLILGNNFTITAASSLVCFNYIEIGCDCLLSWDILIIDTDFHNIVYSNGHSVDESKRIILGNKIWIGCRCTLLKGTDIKENCVVGANSLLNKNYDSPNILIAGNPAKKIRDIKEWKI
ncbi:MAG: acyltransferase [Ignavibacteria bacterium]|nr:acyltransferase [Ignavibacteria bacterium]